MNIFSSTLTEDNISSKGSNCSLEQDTGDLFAWSDFDSPYMANDVLKVEPSICGGSDCPPGYTGSLCDILIGKYIYA